jgi:hypothetical protein
VCKNNQSHSKVSSLTKRTKQNGSKNNPSTKLKGKYSVNCEVGKGSCGKGEKSSTSKGQEIVGKGSKKIGFMNNQTANSGKGTGDSKSASTGKDNGGKGSCEKGSKYSENRPSFSTGKDNSGKGTNAKTSFNIETSKALKGTTSCSIVCSESCYPDASKKGKGMDSGGSSTGNAGGKGNKIAGGKAGNGNKIASGKAGTLVGKGEKSSSTKGKGANGTVLSKGKAGGKRNKIVSGKAGTVAGKGEKNSSTKGNGVNGTGLSKGKAGGKRNKIASGKAGTVAWKGEKNSSTKGKGHFENNGIKGYHEGTKILKSSLKKNSTRTGYDDENRKRIRVKGKNTKTLSGMKADLTDLSEDDSDTIIRPVFHGSPVSATFQNGGGSGSAGSTVHGNNIFSIGTKASKNRGWDEVDLSTTSRTDVGSSVMIQENTNARPELGDILNKGTQDSRGRDGTKEAKPRASTEQTMLSKNIEYSLQSKGEKLYKKSMTGSVKDVTNITEHDSRPTRNFLRGQSTDPQVLSPGTMRANIFQRSSMIGQIASKNSTEPRAIDHLIS